MDERLSASQAIGSVEIVGYATADGPRWIARYLTRISGVLDDIGTERRERNGMESVTTWKNNQVGADSCVIQLVAQGTVFYRRHTILALTFLQQFQHASLLQLELRSEVSHNLRIYLKN
jgi:hypothetical protein